MAGSSRKDAARARLTARRGLASDGELIDGTLGTVSEAVERRDPPSGDQANKEVSAEIRQMRAEKRTKGFVTARTHG